MTVTYITSGQAPPLQTTFIATSAEQPPQTTYVEVIEDPRAQRNYNRWTNKHSAHSATVGLLLFTYGGMDMAQGLQWNLNTGVMNTYEFEFSWFVGVIIGAVVAALTVTHVPKRYFYLLGGVMLFIDAIIFVSAPYDYSPIVAARYVGGVGIGLITVAFIIHNSEVTLGCSRGKWCGLEQFGLALGILIQVLMDSQWNFKSSIGINTAHGIIGIIFSVIATGAVVVSVESPIFYLRNNNEDAARSCQTQLLGAMAPTEVNNAIFDEAKRYVMEGTSQSFGAQFSASLMPFTKMIFSRCLVAFTFSVPLSLTMLGSTLIWKDTIYSWPMILWSILRFIGVLLTLCVVDKLGRKFVSLLGLLCMAALMLALAGILSHETYFSNTYFMSQVSRISMAFQFFAGLYVISTPAYLGEAFPMRVKPFLIGLVVCLEQVIHIIVIVTFGKSSDSYFQYFVGVGIILIVSVIIFGVLMPETRGLSLRQAGERFRRVHDMMSY
ncbi:D-xylose-proton symporter-like 2 [Drosophila novamexicana]|uniref:D-xylose-proton symporter-like 2 n=1 Tax=Drosophila novamexicana TaxID=47314 RepID=UPI0011E60725|nr:D-xylose-proton symporter-like 2 [Drosophila novamexicana]